MDLSNDTIIQHVICGCSIILKNLGQFMKSLRWLDNGHAFPKAMTPHNIQSEFHVSGIQPVNSDIFTDDKFFTTRGNRPTSSRSAPASSPSTASTQFGLSTS